MDTPSSSVIPSNTEKDSFYSLKTRQDVADLLRVSDKGLRHLLYGLSDDERYRFFDIPKKSGGVRTICAPRPQLKALQRRLLSILNAVYEPKLAAHGFVKDRSICTNAKGHVRKRNVLNVDLKDFFPSINFGRVRGMFLAAPYGCTKAVATTLAQICCYKNILPQGAPTSPIVSNMICARMDSHLSHLASVHHCLYTRYADDITISTNRKQFPIEIAKQITKDNQVISFPGRNLIGTITNNGFTINDTKTRLQTQDERQSVTGLVTNRKVNVPRTYIRNVRAMLHNWATKDLNLCQSRFESLPASPSATHKGIFIEHLRGSIDFIGTVRGKDDSVYLKLLEQFSRLGPEYLSSDTREKLQVISDRASLVLDQLRVIDVTKWDNSDCNQGTCFYLEHFGIVTCAHAILNDSFIEIYDRHGNDKQFGSVISIDHTLDLAKIFIRDLPERPLQASYKEPVQGDSIWLAGFPHFGIGNTGVVEPGLVIGTKLDQFSNKRILINASIRTGNSGGPVFNSDWKVIGVATKGITTAGTTHESGFFEVIPISQVHHI